MNNNEYDKFSATLVAVGELYGKKLSPAALGIYWGCLKQFDYPAVSDALNRHAMNPDTGMYMPKPADVVKMLQGSSLDAAMQAWTKVDQAVRLVGPYKTVAFDDPIVMRVLQDMGGWVQLCGYDNDAWPFIQKEFENRYKGYANRGEAVEHPARLAGIEDRENLPQGYSESDPILIGNSEKAVKILQSEGQQRQSFISLSSVLGNSMLKLGQK